MKSDLLEARQTEGSVKQTVPNVEEGRAYRLLGDDGKAIFNGVKGTKQPQKYKDCLGTIVFVVHLAVVLYVFVLALYVDDIPYAAYGTLAIFAMCCSLVAGCISFIAFIFMACHHGWVKSSMSISLNVFLGTAIFAAVMQNQDEISVPCITAMVLFFLCTPYVAYNWKRIPFIATNFSVAVAVVKSNFGIFIAAFMVHIVATVWSIIWLVACTWAKEFFSLWLVIPYLISYFWTEQVLKNIMHVTMAGVVGRWWQIPDDRPTGALGTSFQQAISYSFGSICFGSLFVNYFNGLRNLVTYTSERNWQCPHLVASCLFNCARNVFVYMNKWAFVYVGLYGYTFFEAGKNVTILFHGKGWKKLVTDDLADNLIFIMNLAVACLTGVAAMFFSAYDDVYDMLVLMYYHPVGAGFSIGFLVGYLVSEVLFGVLGGTANAIIVCFAESPIAFQINHTKHSEALRDGWVLDLPKMNALDLMTTIAPKPTTR